MKTKDKVTNRQAEKARSAIKAGQIIKRLQLHVLGEPAIKICECGKEHGIFNISTDTLKKMNPSQVKAGLGLLSHVMPKPQEATLPKAVSACTEETRDRLAAILKGYDRFELSELKKRGIKIVFLGDKQSKIVV